MTKFVFIILTLLIITALLLCYFYAFPTEVFEIRGGGTRRCVTWPKAKCHSKALIQECMQYVKSRRRQSDVKFANGTMDARSLLIMDRMENPYRQSYDVNRVIKQESEEYEEVVGDHLKSLGLEFLTENDIRRLNASGEMKSSLTPDFLFSEPFMIEYDGKKHLVNWIDAKDYGCWDSPLVTKKVQAQIDKYNDAFGPGALVYSCGTMCGHSIKNTLVLTLRHEPAAH